VTMIRQVEDYFAKGCGRCARFDTADCATRIWAPGVAALRAVCLEAGLDETAKWGHPCYVHAGRNVAVLGAHRDAFRLSVFEAGLLQDRTGLLARAGPNSAQADTARFTSAEAVHACRTALLDLLQQAKAHAAGGHRAPRHAAPLELPADLTEALNADPALAKAFHALTPGRQRSYVIALSRAKKPETRRAQVLRFSERILAGLAAAKSASAQQSSRRSPGCARRIAPRKAGCAPCRPRRPRAALVLPIARWQETP
jgi:uncharacterized protein YdeI (YjbR/CyaY-like superfamily)